MSQRRSQLAGSRELGRGVKGVGPGRGWRAIEQPACLVLSMSIEIPITEAGEARECASGPCVLPLRQRVNQVARTGADLPRSMALMAMPKIAMKAEVPSLACLQYTGKVVMR